MDDLRTDYINDGVYSSFNSIMFDHQIVYPHVLTLSDEFQPTNVVQKDAQFEECSIWGPTCDSIDCVQPKASLPTNLVQVGDWLRWDNMGAYTICAASQVSSRLFTVSEFEPLLTIFISSRLVQWIPSFQRSLHDRYERRLCTRIENSCSSRLISLLKLQFHHRSLFLLKKQAASCIIPH